MSRKVRSRKRDQGAEPTAETSEERNAITVRLDDDHYKIVKLAAVDLDKSLNKTVERIIAEWWMAKSERERSRYEKFLERDLPGP